MNGTAKSVSTNRSSQPKSRATAQIFQLREAAIWQPVANGWKQLYGGFYDLGVSIESHDFKFPQPFQWSRTFHPESLELCLNLDGQGSIHCVEATVALSPRTAAFYLPGNHALQAWRDANQRHHFMTIEFSSEFIRRHLASCDGALHPLAEAFLQGNPPRPRLGEIHKLTAAQEQFVAHLLDPPVPQRARPLWYEAKVLEIMTTFFFAVRGDNELFCDRQKRLARERVDRVIGLLRKDLAEPLSLEEIGREVGCSPFHLSRTFSREMGMSIPQYLRKLRMERAGELLRSGKYNVTEAALEVGYSSLSHFSQAFCQTMGCCPGLYPLKAAIRELPAHSNPRTIQEEQR